MPLDKLVPGSAVFTPPAEPVPLDDYSRWWRYVPGTNVIETTWMTPQGWLKVIDTDGKQYRVQIGTQLKV